VNSAQRLADALAPLLAAPRDVSGDELAAVAAAIDDPEAAALLSACCRAIALRALITAASQSNNAEASRRAAMTLLEKFPDAPHDHPTDDEALAFTRALLEQAADPTPADETDGAG